MKRLLKLIAALVVLAPLLAFGWLSYNAQKRLAAPAEAALAALVTDAAVRVEAGEWLVMRPAAGRPTAGLIFYPGANCDVRGYAPVLREVAARGYLVAGVSMPFDLAILGPNRAHAVQAAFPEIDKWVIAGHSMGGAMAARYAFYHEDELAGLILWDSYPADANSLADSKLPVVSILRATPDGTPSQVFEQRRHLLPDDGVRVPIPGGNHMYFGAFDGGAYVEEWDAIISRETQQVRLTEATLSAIGRMTAQSPAN